MSRLVTFTLKTPQNFQRFLWAVAHRPQYLILLAIGVHLAGSAMPHVCPHRGHGYPLGGDAVQSSLVCLDQAYFRVFKRCDFCHEHIVTYTYYRVGKI